MDASHLGWPGASALGTGRRSKDLRHPLYVSASDAVVAELALQTKIVWCGDRSAGRVHTPFSPLKRGDGGEPALGRHAGLPLRSMTLLQIS